MSGKKQFDEMAVLDSAMKVFWQSGFEGTSLAQLEAATGSEQIKPLQCL